MGFSGRLSSGTHVRERYPRPTGPWRLLGELLTVRRIVQSAWASSETVLPKGGVAASLR